MIAGLLGQCAVAPNISIYSCVPKTILQVVLGVALRLLLRTPIPPVSCGGDRAQIANNIGQAWCTLSPVRWGIGLVSTSLRLYTPAQLSTCRDQVPHSSIAPHDWTSPLSDAYKRAMEAAIPSHMASHPGLLQDARKIYGAHNSENGQGTSSDENAHSPDKPKGTNDETGVGGNAGLARLERSRRKMMASLMKGTEAGNRVIPTETGVGEEVAPRRLSGMFLRRGTHAGVVESGEPPLRPMLLHLGPKAFMDPDSAAEVQCWTVCTTQWELWSMFKGVS